MLQTIETYSKSANKFHVGPLQSLPFVVGSYENLFHTNEDQVQMLDILLLTIGTLYPLVERHSFVVFEVLLQNYSRIAVTDIVPVSKNIISVIGKW